MTEQQHAPIEDLAAYAAGDLDAAAAVTVEAHVLLCGECRSDVEAVRAATAALASVPPAGMPVDVAARLDAAIAAERAPSREPAGTVLPMARRRRPSFAGLSAVAAVVALVAAISIPLVTGGAEDRGGTGGSGGDAAAAPESAGTRRLASGLPYSRENLTQTLNQALSGATAPAAERVASAPLQRMDATAQPPGAIEYGAARDQATTSLRTDPARLASCIQELVGTGPVAGRAPLVVDFGFFEDAQALILVFPSMQSNGQIRPGRVDVYVVGGGCGVEPGGDILDFQRIPTPRL